MVEPVTDGKVIYNTLTRELLYMTDDEYENLYMSDTGGFVQGRKYLIKHWFLIEDGLDETSLSVMFDRIYQHTHKQQQFGRLTRYTILTTTGCNANCPYCYEMGIPVRTMNNSTALDLADYISMTASGYAILVWFGGEPLMNAEVITTVCKRLREKGVIFHSRMISNGYLFDTIGMDTICKTWLLDAVQITLDGTEERYNKTKNYIYPDANGFQKVMDNIGLLLAAGISVDIRLNLSKDNIDDIKALIDVLYERFGKFKGKCRVYAHPLTQDDGDVPSEWTPEEREYVFENYAEIQDKLIHEGFFGCKNLRQVKTHNCMADNNRSVVVMPEGRLSICEHHTEDELIGNIYSAEYNIGVITAWRQRQRTERCKTCPMFPLCTNLLKCPGNKCTEDTMRYEQNEIRLAMRIEYERSVVRK